MAEVMLDRSRILTAIGKIVAAAVPQHVAVNEEGKPRRFTGPRNHALITGHAQWRTTLADEDTRA